MTTFVGVDAGGTRTRAAVSENGTDVLARAEGPAGTVRAGRAMVAASAITETVRSALAQAGRLRADVLVVGAAGAGRAPERDELRSLLRGEGVAERVQVTTDVALVLEDATAGGPAIALIAGTGSIAAARNAAGEERRAGGHGWQMSDLGSGYHLGVLALRAAARAHDGLGPATALTDALTVTARAEDFDGLVRWAAGAQPAEVAALAPAVERAATGGDAVAKRLIDEAAGELVLLAEALVAHAGVRPAPLVASGGLLEPGRALRAAFERALADHEALALRAGTADALAGALRLARTMALGGA